MGSRNTRALRWAVLLSLTLAACSRELAPGAGVGGAGVACGPNLPHACSPIDVAAPTGDDDGSNVASAGTGSSAGGAAFDGASAVEDGGAGGNMPADGGGVGRLDAGMDASIDAGGGGAGGAGAGTSGAGGAGGTAAGVGMTGGTGGGTVGCDPGDTPVPAPLPTAQGTCPTLTEGEHTLRGMKVRVWIDPANTNCGPLLFYWHGTGGTSLEGQYFFVDEIKAQGGMVASFDASSRTCAGCTTTGNNVWFYEDFAVADEVVACAVAQGVVDTRRIHATGISAGALQTTAMSYARSRYLASVATLSGGVIDFVTNTTPQDPANKFAAMIVHGGTTDVVGISFKTASEAYRDDLQGTGHFAFICDHGTGHTVPPAILPPVWRFFQDHRYQTSPSPYAGSLPGSFPNYCAL